MIFFENILSFKAISAMGLHSPTPIQAATVPIALLGRDICACAVTGSGNLIQYLINKDFQLIFRKNYCILITYS